MIEEEQPVLRNSLKAMTRSGVIKRTDTGMHIRLADLHVKPELNRRQETDLLEESINELVNFMRAGGQVPALEVYARDEGGVWIVEGHRRRLSYQRLAEAGEAVDWIKITPFVGNDAERVARIATSNSQLPLTPLELAGVYRDLRAFNWSPAEIARRTGRGRDHVDRMLALIDANVDVQQMVSKGEVAPAVAVEHVKRHGEKAGEVLAGKLEQAKAAGQEKVIGRAGKAQPKAVKGISWKADGEANIYTLHRDGQWIARIQMNGELNVYQHEAMLNAVFLPYSEPVAEVDTRQLSMDGLGDD